MSRGDAVRVALAAAALVVTTSGEASAFCRMRACDRTPTTWSFYPPPCVEDEETECLLYGKKLKWQTNCLSFSVQQDGSASSGIAAETARAVIAAAFETWQSADCGGGETPSFSFVNLGEVECRLRQFNRHQPNANIFLFRDDDWPYPNAIGTQLALTTTTYEFDHGHILDADVEFNAHQFDFTVSDAAFSTSTDLASVATHEIGHFLGLSHTVDVDATMHARGNGIPFALRTLEADDIAGLCEIYPPGDALSQKCPVRGGYSEACGDPDQEKVLDETAGCAVNPRARHAPNGLGALVAAALVTALRRVRLRRAPER